jgi:hypothetical protein
VASRFDQLFRDETYVGLNHLFSFTLRRRDARLSARALPRVDSYP